MEKPQKLEIIPANIPEELKDKKQWVVWRWVWNKEKGKWDKPPFNAKTGLLASSTKKEDWADFSIAYNTFLYGGCDGIGFVLDNDYVGIDFDDSRDKTTGDLKEPARSDAKAINSYTEISPSQEGFKIFVKANLPRGGHHDADNGIFQKGRYFCITGNTIKGFSKQIESRQAEVDDLIKKKWPNDLFKVKPKQNKEIPSKATEDSGLVEKMLRAKSGEKFKLLWQGDFSNYPSPSEGDLALCSILAFWTGKNPTQMDNLFRQSGLMRDKWDEKHGSGTYGEITINKAIEGTIEVYTSPTHQPLKDSYKSETIRSGRNLTEEIRAWVDGAFSRFTTEQIYKDLGVTEPNKKAHVRVEIGRLIDKGILERGSVNGSFIKIESQSKTLEIKSEKPVPLKINLPGDLQKRVSIYRHNLLVVAGSSNGGKTAYALNAAYDNRNLFDVNYLTTEMDSDELTLRVHLFNYPLKEWSKVTFKPWESIHSIRPDSLNVVDYLEVKEGEFWRVGDDLRKIFEKLNTGVALVCLQMDKGSKFGWGGQKTVDKARLYFTLDDNKLTIIKGKNWAGVINPNGEVIPFKIIQGSRFEWERG